MNKLLIDEPSLQVLPSLAVTIGLNEAIVLQWMEEFPSTSLRKKVFPFWSNRTIKRIVKSLLDQGLILTKNQGMSPDDAVRILKNKSPQQLKEGNEECIWCGGITLSLQSHHYPIPSRLGGTDTVLICANCHCEYHTLVDRSGYILTKNGEALLGETYNE